MEDSSQHKTTIFTTLPVERWMEFRELRLRALQTEPTAFGLSHAVAADYPDELWKSRLRDVHDGISWIVLAERSGSLVGMVGAFQSDDNRDRRNATVWGVFVDEGERGRGIGHSLLAALLVQLAASGILTAKLTVNKEQTAAVRLYERHGFRIVGHETALLGDGQEHDELIMELLVPRSRSSA
jgi:ribosomal protein S18 acetylase RimI-like enzyme